MPTKKARQRIQLVVSIDDDVDEVILEHPSGEVEEIAVIHDDDEPQRVPASPPDPRPPSRLERGLKE